MATQLDQYFEQRKKELGIGTELKDSGNNLDSFFNSRKMDLGIIPDTRPKLPPATEQDIQHFVQFASTNPMDNLRSNRPMLFQPHDQFAGQTLSAAQPGGTPAEDIASGKVVNPEVLKQIQAYKPFTGTPKSPADQFGRVISDFTMNAINSAALGAPELVSNQAAQDQGVNPGNVAINQKGAAAKAGAFAGQIVPISGAFGATKGLTNFATSGLKSNLGKKVIRGALAGEAYEGANQAVDAALNPDSEKTLGQRALRVGETGLLFGGLEAAGPLVSGAKKGVQALKKSYQNALEESNIGLTPFGKTKPYDALRTDTKSQLVTKTTREPTDISQTADKLYAQSVDNLNRLNTFDKTVERVSGKKLSPSDRSYILGLNSRGSDMIAKQIVDKNLVDLEGNIVGPSYKSIISQIPKGKTVDFEDYLINKHAITRMNRGEKVFRDELGMTPEKAVAKVTEYETKNPEFKQLADEYYKWRNQLAQSLLVDSGLIPQEALNAWIKQNPNFVRMQRQFSDIEKTGMNGKVRRGFANQSNPVKKYSKTGSQRKIISPIESDLEDILKYVKAAKRNQVMQAVIRNLSKNPEDLQAFAELVPKGSSMNQFAVQDINKILQEDGIDGLIQQFDDQFLRFNKENFNRSQTDNIVTGLVNGEKIPIKINDPAFFDALTNLNPIAQHELIRAVGQVTRMMKVLTTGINPVFSLTRNLFRDIPEAYKNSKTTSNPVVFAKDLIGAWVSVIRNGELYQSFKNVGGGHASSIAADRNLLAQSKRNILPAKGAAEKVRQGVGRTFAGLENLNNAVEAAPRLAEFKRVVKRGGNTPESRIQALYEANDVTTNFNKYGNIGKQVDAFFPYFNAAIQGLDKWVRSYKDNPVKAVAKSFTAVTVPTVVLYAINHDNPDYQKLSSYIKDNYFVFPKGDGTFIKIPKPRETGTVFSTLIERLLQKWWHQDPKAFQRFSTSIINSFVPPGASGLIQQGAPGIVNDTIAGPLVDLYANKNFYGGSIVPGYLQGVSPRYQYDERTSEIAKYIGDKFNLSPKQIDYLIRSYGGVIGQIGIPATSQGSSLKETLIRQVTADPTFSNDIIDDFYNHLDTLNRANQDFKQTGIKPKDYDNPLRLEFGRVSRKMSDIRKQIREIQRNQLMPNKEEKLRELQEQMNEIALKANYEYDNR